MKKLVAIAVAALAFAGAAAATPVYTAAGLAVQTKVAMNQRLAFVHVANQYKVTTVRCQKEGPVDFFCIVRLSHYGQSVAAPMYYRAHINGSGFINWSLQR